MGHCPLAPAPHRREVEAAPFHRCHTVPKSHAWLWNAAGGLWGRLDLIRQNVEVPPSAAPRPGASRRVALLPALLHTGEPLVSRQQCNALLSKTATEFPYPFPSSGVQHSSWPFTPYSWSPSPRPAPWQAPGSGHTECPPAEPPSDLGCGCRCGCGVPSAWDVPSMPSLDPPPPTGPAGFPISRALASGHPRPPRVLWRAECTRFCIPSTQLLNSSPWLGCSHPANGRPSPWLLRTNPRRHAQLCSFSHCTCQQSLWPSLHSPSPPELCTSSPAPVPVS